MKKMTNKEFEQAFDSAYGEGAFDIYGYEGVLNMISILERLESLNYQRRNMEILARDSQKIADNIHSILKNRDYYR